MDGVAQSKQRVDKNETTKGLTLFSSRCSAGMCILQAYVLDQSMGRMLPKFPVIVHHILRTHKKMLLLKNFVHYNHYP